MAVSITFGALSSFLLAGVPVCSMGTTRSFADRGGFFMGALIVNKPSEDSDDLTLSGITSPIKRFRKPFRIL